MENEDRKEDQQDLHARMEGKRRTCRMLAATFMTNAEVCLMAWKLEMFTRKATNPLKSTRKMSRGGELEHRGQERSMYFTKKSV